MSRMTRVIRHDGHNSHSYFVVSADPNIKMGDLANCYVHLGAKYPNVTLNPDDYKNIDFKEISVKKYDKDIKFHIFMNNNFQKHELMNTEYYIISEDPTMKTLCKIYLVPFKEDNLDAITFHDLNDFKVLTFCFKNELFEKLYKLLHQFYSVSRIDWVIHYAEGRILCKMEKIEYMKNSFYKYYMGFEKNFKGSQRGQFIFILNEKIELRILEQMFQSFMNKSLFYRLQRCFNTPLFHGGTIYKDEAEKYGLKTVIMNQTINDFFPKRPKRTFAEIEGIPKEIVEQSEEESSSDKQNGENLKKDKKKFEYSDVLTDLKPRDKNYATCIDKYGNPI